jgi:hypothetical protein
MNITTIKKQNVLAHLKTYCENAYFYYEAEKIALQFLSNCIGKNITKREVDKIGLLLKAKFPNCRVYKQDNFTKEMIIYRDGNYGSPNTTISLAPWNESLFTKEILQRFEDRQKHQESYLKELETKVQNFEEIYNFEIRQHEEVEALKAKHLAENEAIASKLKCTIDLSSEFKQAFEQEQKERQDHYWSVEEQNKRKSLAETNNN